MVPVNRCTLVRAAIELFRLKPGCGLGQGNLFSQCLSPTWSINFWYQSVADPDLHLRRGGSTFEGLTMNVEFCEDNSGSSKKMHYFRKNKGEEWPLPWIHQCAADYPGNRKKYLMVAYDGGAIY